MLFPFADKEIVLGVTGSIAAYKACDIASRLMEAGARVTTVLTRSAREFVGAASFEGITRQRVITDMFDELQNPQIEHIAMAKRADLFLIAPATANILAKHAHGMADDWLTTTLLATRAPVLFAPAMNTQMYTHPATQDNIALLRLRDCHFVGPEAGQLACGDVGPGRLIDTRIILEAVAVLLRKEKGLAGKTVLITSGANHEPIDPVRYIGNRSSGRMGRALALEALQRGAKVIVVSGPAEIPLPEAAEIVPVQTAQEMFDAVRKHWEQSDIFIGAAAVADYQVENPATEKHKRNGADLTLTLKPNPDIAAYVGAHKREGQVVVGFAAETSDMLEHAAQKLEKKKLDLMVANPVGGENSTIGADTSAAWFLRPNAKPEELGCLDKAQLAQHIFDAIAAAKPSVDSPRIFR